ncbi:afadin isoform X3 [Octopus sinensis]|uniref:Afadin isoform X3 n=1 Tax=Octopus sinensis TaxID=2607531 RepID=A0A6P7SQB5_9MOLL|nr:afadin isoform X3 [Octopus sinensis]
MTKYRPDDDEFRRLVQLITQWNDDHYDIFEIAQPNENLEFHGVMRFFFQDAGAKVATKCIRVSSTATAKEVIDVLIEKFRPDMRMLTQSNYNLYEVHPNLDERKLAENELPLVIQLNWGTDMRDGRFLLKCENAITAKDEFFEIERDVGGFKRKLSKREKKEKKKREKERLRNKENLEKDATLAEKLYTDVPENSFTRSISNPEAVMRRRRQQKVEKRLQEFRNEEGGSESGGMLKVYGEALSPNIPYKTLLVSATDTASFVVEETLEKYGYPKEEAYKYCLVQVTVPKGDREYHGGSFGEESFVQDDDYPLSILLQHVSKNAKVSEQIEETIIFQLRLRPQDDRKKERIRAVSHNDLRHRDHSPESSQYQLPYLVEIHPGMDEMDGRRHHLQLNVTEVGSEKPTSESGQYLQLFGPNIHPCHCVIAHMNGSVTVTPTRKDAETYINNRRIYETTLLQHGMLVQFGDHHVFRFCDSRSDERPSKVSRSPDHRLQNNQRDSQIRQYDPEMDAGTYSKQIEENIPRHERAREEMLRNAPNSITHSPARQPTPSGKIGDEVLPAALEFREDAQTPFLSELIPNVKCNAVQFKLAPTYTLYLAIRYRLSNIYRPEIEPAERALRLTNFINKMSSLIQQTIKEKSEDPASLAFWMANASEILNFLKQDQDIRLFSREAQDILAESVQMAFHHLVNCLHFDLSHTMPAFVNDDDSVEDDDFSVPETGYRQKAQPTLGDVLRTLTAAMNLLRRCRVNAALTIQLFSQLFHFINMWLFNLIIQKPQFNLCTRRWGIILKRRLGKVEAWAEKQGLELAADCHLCRIIQAAHLLQAPKNNNDDIANISSTCFKLNSLQIQALLQNYIPEDNEPRIPQSLIDRVVTVARNMADDLAHSDGNEIKLEEDRELQLPFLLPEDGYSCDIIRGVPNGLPDFLEAFIRNGVCRFTPQPSSKGLWTVYMVGLDQQGPRLNEIHQKEGGFPAHVPHPDELPPEPEIIEVVFEKVKGSIGLSIVAAKITIVDSHGRTGDGQMSRGIYIKSVVPGGAAALDGRLQAGDQLLEVDGRSLVGLSQEKAANLMTKTGHVVRLKVSKQGAIYHGLATLLSQPSPVIPRANSPKRNGPPGPPNAYPNKGRHRSEENLNVNGMPNDMARQTPLHQGPSRDFRDMPRQGTPLQQGPPPEMARHGPPHQGPPHQGPPHQGPPHQGPPHQGPPHQGPPHQGPPHQGPPHQGPPHQGPPHQGPPHQGPLYEMAHSGMPVQGSSREMPRQGMPHDMVRPGPPRQGSPQTSSPREMSRQGPPQPGSPRNPNQGSPQYQGPPRDMIRHQGPPPPGYKKEFRDGPPRIQAHDVRPQYYTLAPQSSPSINSEGSASDPRNQKNNPNYQSRTLPQGEVMKPPPGSMQHLRDPNMSNQQDSPSNLRNPAANGPMRVNQGSPHRQQQHHLGQPFMNGGNRPGFEQRNASPNNQIPPTDPRYPGPLARSPDISKQQDPPGKAMDNRNIDPYQRIPENARQGSINKQQDPLRYSRAGPTEMVRHVQSIPDRGAAYTPSPIPPYQQKGTPPLANQPPTSVHSPVNNAMKDDRPVSVAYPGSRPDRQDYSGNQLRPRSDEISTDKVREWQMKYDLDNSRNYGGLNGTEQNFNRFGNLTESPEQKVQPSHYAKIRAEPPSQEIRQDIPKASVNNQARQQHFFEKTKERMQEPAPPFHQLPKAGDQHIVKKPTVPPKKVALKPVEPIPATADIGRVNVQENHVLHQNLYNARLGPEEHLYMPPTATANRMAYVDHEGSYLPPPPEIPPDLPPPPAPEDLQDILPPPPPDNIKYNNYPPENVQWNQSNRYSEEFSRVDFHDNLKEGPTYQHMVPNNMNSNSHTQYTIQQNNYNRDPHANEKQFGHQGFLPSHTGPDNIVKNKSGPPLPPPPQEQPQLSSSVPYWDGDEDIDPHDINRLRELEIKKLTEMKYRQPQDEDRLRKLQLEEEFQRRVKEVGDRDDDDDDDGSEAGYSQYRVQSREWLINTMQDDLQKILNRLRQMEEDQATEEYEKEKDRMKCLRQRLEIFEKEKAEDQIRQQKRQQRKQLEQEQHLQKQREMREKQRRDIEEQRKLYLMEEEMMKERKIEELRKKKEMEKEQILATREAEEFRQQAEQKRLEEKQLQEQADRQMGRYSNISKSNISSKMYSNNTYTEHGPNLTYQTAPEKNFTAAPQPPERGSSFETLNQYQQRNLIKPLPSDQMTPDNNNMGKSVSTSALRTNQDVTAPKKSVSFNTQLETRISAAYSDDERSSNPSFRSSGEFSPNLSPSFLGNSEPSELTSKMTNEVFTQDSHQSTPPPPPTANSVEVHYRIAETPGVIGGQEIYRDPRTRIQAKKAAGSAKSPGPERMSFRDKMKYFAQEAGEGTPKEKSKASRVQRDIEYAMNGQ